MEYDLLFFMVSSASSSSSSWLFDVFSWERLASVATVFGLGIGGAVPLYNMLKKYKERKRLNKEQEETERISKIAKETINPIAEKLDHTMKVQEQVTDKIQQTDKDTKAILSTVRTLVKEFHNYKGQQEKINTKIYFMDGYIRNADSSTSLQPSARPKRYMPISKEEDEIEEYHDYDINRIDNDNNNNNNDSSS